MSRVNAAGSFRRLYRTAIKMLAALLGDKTARQFNHVAAHHRRDQRARMQRLREDRQAAERMIDAREIFFEMAADLADDSRLGNTSTKRNNATRSDSSSSDQSIIRPSKSLASKSDGFCRAAL